MRKVLIIAWGGLLRTARDKKALALLLLMPMILIGILGQALNNMMDEKIQPFKVAVVNVDRPARPALPPGAPPDQPTFHFGQEFATEVLGSAAVQKIIIAVPMTDLAAAKAELEAGRVRAVVHLPETLTADVLALRKATVQVYTDPGHPTPGEIVTQVAQAFADSLTTGTLAMTAGSAAGQPPLRAEDIFGQQPVLKEVAAGARHVTALQYYAAAMALMFMVMTALGRAADLIEERTGGTLARILVSPTGKATVLAGQVLGTVVIVVLQFVILLIGTHYLYGVYWGPWGPVLLLGVSFGLAAGGVGTIAAGILHDAKAADASVGVVGNVFGALSGGMFPLWYFPPALTAVARFIPNYWGMQGLLDQMAGFGVETIWAPVAILAAIGLAGLGLGTWRLATR